MPLSKHGPDLDLASLFDEDWASGDTSLDDFLKRVLAMSVTWFGAGAATLFLRIERAADFYLAAQAGPDARVPARTVLTSGVGIAGQAIETGAPVLVTDPTEIGHTGRRGVGSAMVIPLQTPESGCIGVLNVSRPEGAPALLQSDLRKAKTVARYVALAVNNARLFSRLNHAVSQSRALTAKLDAIIANLGVGVMVTTSHGEVTDWNSEASRVLGKEIRAGSYLEHLLRTVSPRLQHAIQEANEGALTGTKTSRRAFDATSERAWTIVASPLPGGDVTIAIQDVSEHERVERELARLNRLAEIGQMTAAVAHEIRNPLTGIRSAAQMVQSCGEEAGEIGKIIEEEALKLNALCDQFLEFARPLHLSIRDIRAGQVAARVAEFHRADFRKANVNLEVQIDAEEPTIQADPHRLEQVVRNLLLNALQACQPGQTVCLRVEAGRLEVLDTGTGMEQEQVNSLFTPFFTTKANGTGLGLPTVRKITDAHGWTISVDSQPEAGTTFAIEFRLEQAA